MQVRGWEQMRVDAERRLVAATGADLSTWARRSQEAGVEDEAGLRRWLGASGVQGYGQMFVVMERFGYPDYLTADAGDLVDSQYVDRPALRPVLDAVLAVAAGLDGTHVQARKGYVGLVARRQFAVVKPTTRTRVDLGLRLDGEDPGGRLLPARSLANAAINLRMPLTSVEDVDGDVQAALARAHAASA